MNTRRGCISIVVMLTAALIFSLESPAAFGAEGNLSSASVSSESARVLPQSDTLVAGSKKLMVYNTGRLGGNNDGVSLDIPGDCDDDLTEPNGDMYLRDASPVIVWNNGSANIAYTALFNQTYTEPGTFCPQSDLHFTAGTDYTLVACTLSSSDSLFGVGVRIFAPTDPDLSFIIVDYRFSTWKPGLKGAEEVYIGAIANWDVPSDVGVWNGSGYEAGKDVIYQFGYEAEAGDTDEDPPHSCPIYENNRFGGIRLFDAFFQGAWTAPTVPMQEGSGFNSDSLFAHMSASGYNIYSESDTFDLHTGIAFDAVDLSYGATYDYLFAMATSNVSLDDLNAQLDSAKSWGYTHWYPDPGCCVVPGDANHDGVCNVGDAVFLIDRIFRGGPPPPCPNEADATADCAVSIGDPVYIINYIFKNGPAPICGCVP